MIAEIGEAFLLVQPERIINGRADFLARQMLAQGVPLRRANHDIGDRCDDSSGRGPGRARPEAKLIRQAEALNSSR